MTDEEITALKETNKALTERVNQLESINTSLVDQKKELKQKLEDGATDEELKAELDNYKSQLSQVETDKESMSEGYSKEINSLKMSQLLRDMKVDTPTTHALNQLTELILADATPTDTGFAFLNEDGTTRFNDANKDFSVMDKINELKESDTSYLFSPATGGGATGNGATPPPQTKTRTQMTLKEKIEYRTTNGEEAYMSLPLA